MSEAEVTRAGLEHVRPGRESLTWSGTSNGSGPRQHEEPRDRAAHDHPGASYYGRPIVKAPVWEEREIAGYFFLGGLAGASSLLACGAALTGRPALARASRSCATAAAGLSLGALVKDLGRPSRFWKMLRVFKPTSPMSVGVWLVGGYAQLAAAAAVSDLLGRAPRLRSVCDAGAAIAGSAVCTYTAALIGDTAVPVWHEAHREMPLVFAGSAASAAAGFGMLAAPLREAGPARRMALIGALSELAAEQAMERRLGPIASVLHEDTAGRRMRIAKALTAAGAAGAATVARRSRLGAVASGAALLAGSALTRFGIFAAGVASAQDPAQTVAVQRDRVAG